MQKNQEPANNPTRRSFLQLSAITAAGISFRVVTEPMLASAGERPALKDGVYINANENPLGPAESARAAASTMVSQGGRYSGWLNEELINTFAAQEGLKPNYVHTFPGSSEPLHYSVLAFTSPTKSYVTADPGYEAGMYAAKISGARVAKTPLTKTYSHDAKAMLATAPDAGLLYVCNPNNPTGTVTGHDEIEFLVANKPKDSVVVVDEAYIHLSDTPSALDLVKADKDVIVLRTFSKVYGMAGLRAGFAICRPDLLAKVTSYSGWNAMPITAVAAATASLKDSNLIPERKHAYATTREQTFEWLRKNGYAFTPSQSNCFMLDTKRPAKSVIDDMASQKVFIGRAWPVWPTWVRITIGTPSEMDRFQSAFASTMKSSAAATTLLPTAPSLNRNHLDGLVLPESV
jgi:histidinol-phosphate aminotransferase